jgi:hypothetical protein
MRISRSWGFDSLLSFKRAKVEGCKYSIEARLGPMLSISPIYI